LSPKERDEDRSFVLPSEIETSAQNPSTKGAQILLAEDNRGDILLVREALDQHGVHADLLVTRDGGGFLQLLDRIEAGELPCPDLVLLDLNLPQHNGAEILAHLRQSTRCSQVHVVVVTSSNARKDRDTVARLGASGYFLKPSDYDEFMRLGEIVRQMIEPHKPN
jgi:CheY-like chemotaxis protein